MPISNTELSATVKGLNERIYKLEKDLTKNISDAVKKCIAEALTTFKSEIELTITSRFDKLAEELNKTVEHVKTDCLDKISKLEESCKKDVDELRSETESRCVANEDYIYKLEDNIKSFMQSKSLLEGVKGKIQFEGQFIDIETVHKLELFKPLLALNIARI